MATPPAAYGPTWRVSAGAGGLSSQPVAGGAPHYRAGHLDHCGPRTASNISNEHGEAMRTNMPDRSFPVGLFQTSGRNQAFR